MGWLIEFDPNTERDFKALDKPERKRIMRFLHERVAKLEDPRSIGESLRGEKLGQFWKYRIGDYRVICAIQDQSIRILVVRIGHRRDIYR